MSSTSTLLLSIALVCAAGFSVQETQAVPVYVMLQLDAASNYNPGMLQPQLQQLKSAGVEGVMADVWWGLTEPAPQQYNFTVYQELVALVDSVGLKFQAVMSFHRCGGNVGDACNIPLPDFVTSVSSSHDIFYQDREGNTDSEYISLFVDEEPLFGERTPLEMYSEYMQAFYTAFQDSFSRGIITQVEVSMGPAGEMRYPSYPLSRWKFCGIGEFQNYGSYALANLQAAATSAGHSDWGTAGPDNAGTYNSRPDQTGFFSSGQDNYSSAYGEFFLKWYFQNLLNHGDRVLGAAKAAFPGVQIAGKVAGIHWWYKSFSHAAEVTAGYFNTDEVNAYANIAQMFKKYDATFTFTCMEMRDNEQPADCDSGPFELVEQTKLAAKAAGIAYAGENALPRYDQTAYNTILTQSTSEGLTISKFTYLRLGPDLLQSGNFQTFTGFVHSMANI